MLVALHWPEEQLDVGYDLDLYVYGPDGKLAASSTNFQYSSDEAAWIQAPANGTYRVLVAARNQAGTSPFEVNVQFEYGRETTQATTLLGAKPWDQQLVMVGRLPRRPAPLLPDMVMAPAHNFHMETTISCGYYCGAERGLGHPPSCYPQETSGASADEPITAAHPLRCLRFDSDLLNLGAGPFEVRAYPNKGKGTDAFQVIYNSDGTYRERRAGEATFSTAHGHIHYQGLEDTGLYTVGPNGQPGTLVQPMLNKGRCAADTHNIRFGMPNDTPMHYVVPSTCDATNLNQDPNDPVYPNEPYWRSGLSPGWDDEYPWWLVDTYIDVTKVPDGRYLIVTKLNTQGEILESNYSNNTAIACVELNGETATECR
jgi:hypothetical protein